MGKERESEYERMVRETLERAARRYELALLSYEGQFDPDHTSAYAIQPFTLLPEWQQEVHYRVADLVLVNGYRKV